MWLDTETKDMGDTLFGPSYQKHFQILRSDLETGCVTKLGRGLSWVLEVFSVF